MIGLGLRLTSGSAQNALPGIAAPVLTLTGGTTDTPLQPQLNTGAFTLENGAVDTHASTDWQIATDAAFTNVVWAALDSLNLTQITTGLALSETSTYYARARHNGTNYQSQFSAPVMFNTITVSVAVPAITNPAAAATSIGETPTITSSAFAVNGGTDTHTSSDWQVASDTGFTNIVVQSLSDAANKTSWAVPTGNLLVSTGYYVRVRHTGVAQGVSAWSPAISFTTTAAFANPWDLGNAQYENKLFSTSAQDSSPQEVAFSTDGTKMYVVGASLNTIYQYTLSQAWDVSTAGYAGKSFFAGSQEANITGLAFSQDGTRMYVVGVIDDSVYQYSLSTAWDIATASYANASSFIGTQEGVAHSVQFSADGTRMYIVGVITDTVYQYALGTAWDISTASYSGQSFSVAAQEASPTGLSFSLDGTRMFVVGVTNDTVYQYVLNTAWDISTASYAGKSFPVVAQGTSPRAVPFSADGTKMYFIDDVNATIYQYAL